MAAECAGAQGSFWEYHDLLFENQSTLDRDSLLAYAQRVGLDRAAFLACLDSDAPREAIARDVAEGMRLGIESTPTLFLNGRTITGAPRAERARLRDSTRARASSAAKAERAASRTFSPRAGCSSAQRSARASHASRFRTLHASHVRALRTQNTRATCDHARASRASRHATRRARKKISRANVACTIVARIFIARAHSHASTRASCRNFLDNTSDSALERRLSVFVSTIFDSRMMFVGCSRRLPLGGGKTTHRAVVVHEVVERGEKWWGGGELVSCPQLWRSDRVSRPRRYGQRFARGVGAHGGTLVGGVATAAATCG